MIYHSKLSTPFTNINSLKNKYFFKRMGVFPLRNFVSLNNINEFLSFYLIILIFQGIVIFYSVKGQGPGWDPSATANRVAN
jgi:hypothetical protein